MFSQTQNIKTHHRKSKSHETVLLLKRKSKTICNLWEISCIRISKYIINERFHNFIASMIASVSKYHHQLSEIFPFKCFFSFDHIFSSSFCQQAYHLRCFIQKSLFSSVFSDHLLWPAWALGCRHPHYSRSNFLTKYLQTICLQTVSAKMIAIEMIQIGGKWLQKMFKIL